IAVVATLINGDIDYVWILVGVLIGGTIGAVLARRVQMTQMPETVALLNGSGGLASLLVGWVEYLTNPNPDTITAIALLLAILVGGVTVSGSILAWLKLSERITGKPILFSAQQLVNAAIIGGAVILGVLFVINPPGSYAILLFVI